MSGGLDTQLNDYAMAKPEGYLRDSLPIMHAFKSSVAIGTQLHADLKEEEASVLLAEATLEDTISTIEADQARFYRHLVEHRQHTENLQLRFSQQDYRLKETGNTGYTMDRRMAFAGSISG